MIWIQGAVCFLVWVGYGVIQTRRAHAVRAWAKAIPRGRRGLLAAALMFGATLPIFVVLNLALQYNGFGHDGMTAVAWLGVGALGLLFVHGQTLATALLVTSAYESVTAGPVQTSSTNRTHENDDDEAPPS